MFNYNTLAMRKINVLFLLVATLIMTLTGCASLNRTQRGAIIGTAAGAAAGAIVGRTAGNTAIGATVGATVGGVAGAIIGNRMDRQAEEIRAKVPDATVQRVGDSITVELSSAILFAFGSADLSTEARANLDQMATIFLAHPDTNVEVQGHTDNKGTAGVNQRLSERRSRVVTDYLIGKGVAAGRLTPVGFGLTRPKYSNDTEEGRAQNRRVEFVITANEKMRADAEAGRQ